MIRLLGCSLVVLAVAFQPPGRASAQQTSISQDVVRIGVLTDMSGQFSDESGKGAVTAVEMAVQDFGGKVLGKRIEVIYADHQNKPDVAVAKATEWFERDGVDMIANLIVSPIAIAVANIAKSKNRIAIVNGSGSSRITGDQCTPNSIHYSYDTYALAHGTGRAMLNRGGDTWFFLTADYAFGHSLEADTAAVIKAQGGKILGAARYPMASVDLSSFLLQAQTSKAKVVGIAGSGTTFVNAVKAAHEFGLTASGQQTIAGLLVWEPDVHAMGLGIAQGMILTTAFYWDRDDETRTWSKRFQERMQRVPHLGDAGDYSSTIHYLKAIEAAGTDEAQAVMKKMKEMPINDFFAKNGRIREDGRMVHDMYVYQVKSPAESKSEWDYYKPIETIPAEQAFRPLSQSECPLVRK
jgi:branched-chain amino acid transport system substrate-binding protein